MKIKTMQLFLGIEALLCILLVCVQALSPWIFSTVMAFPFEQIGIGNTLAIIFYTILCLVPVIPVLLLYKKQKMFPEDWLLGILSIVLFVTYYFMINPGLIQAHISVAGSNVGKALLGSIVYSILFTYIILRVLRLFFQADTGKLFQYMGALLFILNMLFVALIFGVRFNNLFESFKTLREGNIGTEGSLGPSYVFLILQYVVETLPYALNITVVFSTILLLKELRNDRYSEETVTVTDNLSRLCRITLAISVLANVSFNLLQLLFAKALRSIHGTVQIPLLSVTFVLAVLLLTRFVRENKQLKDDNDTFI